MKEGGKRTLIIPAGKPATRTEQASTQGAPCGLCCCTPGFKASLMPVTSSCDFSVQLALQANCSTYATQPT
jgi:hypothetical protein